MLWRHVFLVFALLMVGSFADIYLHNMRGSNNRLRETPNNRNNANRLFNSQNNNRGGYNQGDMLHYAGSIIPLEWTAQHACGPNNNTNCQLILQWMCEDTTDLHMRDGEETTTIPNPEPTVENYRYGRHETNQYYRNCQQRERNRGLFTSDQNLGGNTAIFTRQNPNGQRYGYECPEERDYYPYWQPTPWKDIAILTNNMALCPYYQSESQNVKDRWYCSDSRFNNFRACNNSGAAWLRAANYSLPAPDCVAAQWSRDNHLGNVAGGFPQMYNWTIPADANFERCVLRLRYNISTGDYDGFDSRINASLNGRNRLRVQEGFFLNNNPTVDIGVGTGLELAINTAQYGRTFQDRSHVFSVRPRPAGVPADARIYNVNVRGKRGNIVQVYPAVEYDFVPNDLVINQGDFVHIQWTGSNTNDPNNDGQGLRGTDRSNVVQIASRGVNYPLRLGNMTMWPNVTNYFEMVRSFATLNQGQAELDDAATHYDGGVLQFLNNGTLSASAS